jgi:hypothetical protein
MIHCLDPYALIGSKPAESAAAMIGAFFHTIGDRQEKRAGA